MSCFVTNTVANPKPEVKQELSENWTVARFSDFGAIQKLGEKDWLSELKCQFRKKNGSALVHDLAPRL